MATQTMTIVADARVPLQEVSASFWTDAELLTLAVSGYRDLWRAYIDLHQEHFLTVDITNVSVAASVGTLIGVPPDTFRVILIQPRDTTDAGAARTLRFHPVSYNSREFRDGLSRTALDASSGGDIYYVIRAAGSPVTAPVIDIAPQLSSAVPLRFVYIPTLPATMTLQSVNPIPGESDTAVKNFIVAYALAKDREDRSPDPNWLALYKTEKDSCLIASAPRQEQRPRIVQSMMNLTPDYDDYDYY